MNILYTTHCPICEMVAGHLKENKIPYEECTDIEEMKRLGFVYVPMFYCEEKDQYMKAQECLLWLHRRGEKNE